jgi:squalene synthase HpnC
MTERLLNQKQMNTVSSDNPTMKDAQPATQSSQKEHQGSKNGVNARHYENFPVASLLCPAHLRPAIMAIYNFARTADDLADEGEASPAQRSQELALYKGDLAACAQGLATSGRWAAVFDALAPQIRQWQLPLPLLGDLLSAFEQDVHKTRYADQAELLDYCSRSANPVGRLLLHLYGVSSEAALRQSDCICTALQLINFWQDLSVDIPRGRIYLPAELQALHGVSEAELLAQATLPATRALVADCVERARRLMLEGAPLVHQVPGRAGWELRLVVQGGLRIAERIALLDFATLRQRPVIGRSDALVMAWRTLWM